MDDLRLRRIEEKLDKIVEKIGAIDITLAAQHVTLVEHTRRSDLLEAKLAPVEEHVSSVHAVLRFLGIVGMLAGSVMSVLKLFKFI